MAEALGDENIRRVFAWLAAYLKEMMKADAAEFHTVMPIREKDCLLLGEDCLRNLEITRNMRDGGRRGTLLEILDHTHTAMGARLLRRWLERPLTDVNRIIQRQDGIEELTGHTTELSQLEEMLEHVFDFERILTRIEANTTSPKDLLALKASLGMIPEIKKLLSGTVSIVLRKLSDQMDIHSTVYELLDRSMNETVRETFVTASI